MMLTHTSTSPVRVHLPGFTSFPLAPAATKIITQAEDELLLRVLDDLRLPVDTEHVQQQGVLGYQDAVSVTKAGAAGATLTCTPLMPAGALVFGVTITGLSTLTGPTRMSRGDGTTADLWGTGSSKICSTRPWTPCQIDPSGPSSIRSTTKIRSMASTS
jgi:hypothetical protein